MLEVQDVSKWFENRRGVEHIDFTMVRGEIIGFLGPNGAGKTTTMRLITGYLQPTSGTIRFDGKSMEQDMYGVRSKIGYLPETPPLYPDMSVLSYLRYVADLRDVSAREQKKRIAEMMGMLALEGREHQLIRCLSKGYKQRLGLAQAIIHKPELLVLDEPTSGLDPNQILEIRQLIRELGERHTVLLSTHILPEVNALCNRVIIIHQGKLVLDEKPELLGSTMGETSTLYLEAKGDSERISTILSHVPDVETVTTISSQASMEGVSTDTVPLTPKYCIKVKPTKDVREQVFYAMANAGYPILEMKSEKASLEEVFQRLTMEEVTADAAV